MTIILERPESSLYYQRGNANYRCCGVTAMAVGLNQPFEKVWRYLYANVMPIVELFPAWLGETTTLDRAAFYSSLGVEFEHLDYHCFTRSKAEQEIEELGIRPRMPLDLSLIKCAPDNQMYMTVDAWANTVAKRDHTYELVSGNHVATFCNGMVFDQACKENKFKPMSEHLPKFGVNTLVSSCELTHVPDDVGDRLDRNLSDFPGELSDIKLPEFKEIFPGFAEITDYMSGMQAIAIAKEA